MLENFLEACKNDDLALVIIMTENLDEESIFRYNSKGWNSLIVSAYNHSFDVLKYLIEECKGDVNTVNKNGTTLLMYAKSKYIGRSGKYPILDYLISKGADILQPDLKMNWSVIEYTKQQGDFELANYFEEKIKEK